MLILVLAIRRCVQFGAWGFRHTLSLNKNKLLSVDNIVRNAAEKFPKLAFLSLLGNPCCPSDLVGGTAQEYSAYNDVDMKFDIIFEPFFADFFRCFTRPGGVLSMLFRC